MKKRALSLLAALTVLAMPLSAANLASQAAGEETYPVTEYIQFEFKNGGTASRCYPAITPKGDDITYTFQKGDVLIYDIKATGNFRDGWYSGGGYVDATLTKDGGTNPYPGNLRDFPDLFDQNGIQGAHTRVALYDKDFGSWYHREIKLPDELAGFTATDWYMGLETDKVNVTNGIIQLANLRIERDGEVVFEPIDMDTLTSETLQGYQDTVGANGGASKAMSVVKDVDEASSAKVETEGKAAYTVNDYLQFGVSNSVGESRYYMPFSDLEYTFQAGDRVEYDFFAGALHPGVGGIAALESSIFQEDGSTINKLPNDAPGGLLVNAVDQKGVSADPSADLLGNPSQGKAGAYYNDRWNHRVIYVDDSAVGKTVKTWAVAMDKNLDTKSGYPVQTAQQNVKYANIVIKHADGTETVVFRDKDDMTFVPVSSGDAVINNGGAGFPENFQGVANFGNCGGLTVRTASPAVTYYGDAVASNNANLSRLEIKAGDTVLTLDPEFSAAETNYTVRASFKVDAITVDAAALDGAASAIVSAEGGLTVEGNTVSGLVPGKNTVKVTVTAADGETAKVYTLTVDKAAALSANAELASLKLEGVTLSPAFDKDTLSYTATVDNAVESVNVQYTLADSLASAEVTGGTELKVGENVVTVTVTAEDGATIKAYTITVTREAPVAVVPQVEKYIKFVFKNNHNAARSYPLITSPDNPAYTFKKGDVISYDIKIVRGGYDGAGSNMGNVDFLLEGAPEGYETNLRDNPNGFDQNGVSTHTKANIYPFANGQWYHREIAMPDNYAGAKAVQWFISQEAKTQEECEVWVANIAVTSADGSVFYPCGADMSKFEFADNPKISERNVDYKSVTLETLETPEDTDTRVEDNAVEYDVDTTLNFTPALISPTVRYYIPFSDKEYTFQKGDIVEYDVFLDAAVRGAGGLAAFDSSVTKYTLDESYDPSVSLPGLLAGARDQNGVSGSPDADLSAYAGGRWYHRSLILPEDLAGKTAAKWAVAVDTPGDSITVTGAASIQLRSRYANIVVKHADGTETVIFRGAEDFKAPNGTDDAIINNDDGSGQDKLGNFSDFNGATGTLERGGLSVASYAPVITYQRMGYTTGGAVEKSDNAYLSSLEVEGAVLSPEFDKNVFSYTASISSLDVTANILAVKEDSAATVAISGNTDLLFGDNVITVKVTAEDGITTNTYTITVNREGIALTDKESGVYLGAPYGVFPEEALLKVEKRADEASAVTYRVGLELDGEAVELDGIALLGVPAGENAKLYRIEDDGTKRELEVQFYKDGKLYVETDALGDILCVEGASGGDGDPTIPSTGEASLALACAGLLAAGSLLVIAAARKKSK